MTKSVKLLMSFMLVLTLAACSIQRMAEKILPVEVQAHAQKAVSAAMGKDAVFFADLQDEGVSDTEFAAALDVMLSKVSTGSIIRSDIIGFNANTNLSLGVGTTRTYNLNYEVRTDNGYTVIWMVYMQSPEETVCCRLRWVTIQSFSDSPYLAALQKTKNIMKVMGIIILLGIFALIFFLIRRSKAKGQS